MTDNNHISKVVDLKPRDKKSGAQLGHFVPNEELLESTARVKSQRDVILERLQKMAAAKDRVSKTVYEKVHRDYSLQMETINDILNEKKAMLKEEIKKLYLSREKLSFEISRHREVLEEAEFRHQLDEFTQAQYQEVENFETKEIERLEANLSHITQWIRRHEELFDPTDFGQTKPKTFVPATKTSEATVTYKVAEPRPEITKTVVATPAPALSTTPVEPQKTEIPAEFNHLFADENAGEEKFVNTEDNIEALLKSDHQGSQALDEEIELPEPSEADYYQNGQVGESSFELQKPGSPAEDEEDSITVSKTASGLHRGEETPLPKKLDASVTQVEQQSRPFHQQPQGTAEDSISEILDSIHLEGEEQAEDSGFHLSATTKSAPAEYKLTVIQGSLDAREFPLKDNTSIGRSPSNDVAIKEPKVSRQHAAINKYNENYILIDLKSSNGVFVNGVKIDEVILHPGDEVSIGSAKFLFEKI